MRSAALIACLLLAGCQTAIHKPPKVVEVVVTKTVPVPAELAKDCDMPTKQDNTVGEAVRLANARKAALEECSKRLAKIRGLTP